MTSFSQDLQMSSCAETDIASLLGAMMELGHASAESLNGEPTQPAASNADMQSLLEEPLIATPEPLAKRLGLPSITLSKCLHLQVFWSPDM